MVKPTLPYLDILSEMRTIAPNHPLACYQVRCLAPRFGFFPPPRC